MCTSLNSLNEVGFLEKSLTVEKSLKIKSANKFLKKT